MRTYLDDFLVITKETFDDHLVTVEAVLKRLKEARLRVNRITAIGPGKKHDKKTILYGP